MFDIEPQYPTSRRIISICVDLFRCYLLNLKKKNYELANSRELISLPVYHEKVTSSGDEGGRGGGTAEISPSHPVSHSRSGQRKVLFLDLPMRSRNQAIETFRSVKAGLKKSYS